MTREVRLTRDLRPSFLRKEAEHLTKLSDLSHQRQRVVHGLFLRSIYATGPVMEILVNPYLRGWHGF
ncbi:hypothetical protein [Bradyrhizobium genosp. P]|uniref:hypothetical protein n=1 Tax=Bradyrhizobium genosp. P TaxID=83641 RepID=UPI003CF88C93